MLFPLKKLIIVVPHTVFAQLYVKRVLIPARVALERKKLKEPSTPVYYYLHLPPLIVYKKISKLKISLLKQQLLPVTLDLLFSSETKAPL